MRYTLDRAKVPYTLINDDDLKRGGPRRALRRHPLSQDRGRPRRPGARHRSQVRPARLHEDPGVPQPGDPRRLGGHHRRHGLRGAAQPRQVRPRRRRADRPRQRRHRCRSTAGSCAGVPARGGRQHAGLGAAGQGGAAGASDRLRLRGADPASSAATARCSTCRRRSGRGWCCSSAPRSPTGRRTRRRTRSRARPPGSRWRISTLRPQRRRRSRRAEKKDDAASCSPGFARGKERSTASRRSSTCRRARGG